MFRDKHEHTRIVSSTPGRTRVKVSLKRRSKEEMGLLATALKDRLHPVDARINIQSGSILVHHPENTLEDVCAVLKDLGVMLVTVSGGDMAWPGGKTKIASEITDAVSGLNRRLGLATSGFVNLQVLVPFGLGALALRQLLRYGWQFEVVPWYVLAYAAFDSFVKLHYSREAQPVQPSSGQDAGAVH
jgi:hypothetical protein